MQFRLLPQKILFILKGIIFVNIFFLAGTWLFHYHFYNILGGNWKLGSNLKLFLLEFSLANENVVATWYSSMLFLTVGIVSFVCFLTKRNFAATKQQKYFSYGWIAFAAIFSTLSFDEMASMHERLGGISSFNPLGDYPLGWIVLLSIPIGITIILMLWFCLREIKQAPLAVAFAVLGILLFVTIPLQEHFEVQEWHAAADRATWMRPAYLLIIEEGTELFGATLMLISTLLFLAYTGNSGNKFSLKRPFYLRFSVSRKKALFVVVLICVLLLLFMFLLKDNPLLELKGGHGIMLNWFPSAVAFLISLTGIIIFFRKRSFSENFRKTSLFTAFFSLFLSVYYGGNIHGFIGNPATEIWRIAFILVLCVTTIVLMFKQIRSYTGLYQKTGSIVWGIFVVAALGINNDFAPAMAFVGFSALFLSLFSRILSQDPKAIDRKEGDLHEQSRSL